MKDVKSGRNTALKVAVVSVPLLIGAWLLLKQYQIDITVTPAAPTNSVPIIKTDSSQDAPPTPPKSANPEPTTKPDPAALAARQGSFRIRNRSDRPVRVALLSRQPKESSAKSSTATSGFALPAHWDFAPQEGSEQGLIVSLPDRQIQLKRGDVVVAFAQDGSQRYWGPYVVGETDRPVWNRDTGNWELTLDQ